MLPEDRLVQIVQRFEFLEAQLNAGPAPDQIARISREYAELKPVVDAWRAYRAAEVVVPVHPRLLGVRIGVANMPN